MRPAVVAVALAGCASGAVQPDAASLLAVDAPAATCVHEICGGGDDDCDGWIDEGCPVRFGRPSPLLAGHVSAAASHLSPRLSADGLHLYFVVRGSDHDGVAMISRTASDSPFVGPPTSVTIGGDLVINAIGLAGDELEMVLQARAASDAEAIGAYDLYEARRATRTSPFGAPTRLTLSVASAYEGDPYVSPDGHTLLYAARGASGPTSIRRATRGQAGDPFTTSEPVTLAGDGDAGGPSISADGQELFFHRTDAHGVVRFFHVHAGGPPEELVDLGAGSARADWLLSIHEGTHEAFFVSARPWSPAAVAIWRVQICRDGACLEPEIPCESEARSVDRRHCYTLLPGVFDRDDAQAACAAQRVPGLVGHLVTIHSAAEQELAWGVAGRLGSWMGIDDRAVEGLFRWETGEPALFTNWWAGEPNNADANQDCGTMPATRAGAWDDLDCASATLAGVCETELEREW